MTLCLLLRLPLSKIPSDLFSWAVFTPLSRFPSYITFSPTIWADFSALIPLLIL